MLRRHGAKATFNLNAGLHDDPVASEWLYRDEFVVRRLPWSALEDVYDGFTIASHSLTHPMPLDVSIDEWTREVSEGRVRLQEHFDQPVLGFAYPFGRHDDATAAVVRAAGHVYGRTVGNRVGELREQDSCQIAPDCHYSDPNFWGRYEAAKTSADGVFWFWGHSYELTDEAGWHDLEHKIASITSDPAACWVNVPDLFT
jgi:peptidoglycan/xylan/chitin deacetylase (PgdA/CDA1 family)